MPPLCKTGSEPATRQLALLFPTEPYGSSLARLDSALNAMDPATTTLGQARLFVRDELARSGEITDDSLARFMAIWSRFEAFADRAFGVETVAGVTGDLVRTFVVARVSGGGQPSVATQKVRVSAIRLWWEVLRRYHLATDDPTLDVTCGARTETPCRTLTDDEVATCRWASLATTIETRQPAIWSLAESGASTSEIGAVTLDDLDLTAHTVALTGGSKGFRRTVPLTDWAVLQLARRVESFDGEHGVSLTYSGVGGDHSRRTAVTGVLTSILRRAGLGDDPLVGPRSITAWAGAQVLIETGRIEVVAHHLGFVSLDLAAKVIGFDWRAD